MVSSIALALALAFSSATFGIATSQQPLLAPEHKVNVSLYVMSRCPDARLCESVFEDVVKSSKVADKIDLGMHYIAHINHSAPYGVSCMHGDLECAGDAHQLCLSHHLPLDQFYPVLACLNYGTFPGQVGTIALTRRCAETAGVDWWASGVGKCIEGKRKGRDVAQDGEVPFMDVAPAADIVEHLGKRARRLLIENVITTALTNITTSCTIEIDSTLVHGQKRRCVVDGGVWKGCDDGHTAADFIRVIQDEWANLN